MTAPNNDSQMLADLGISLTENTVGSTAGVVDLSRIRDVLTTDKHRSGFEQLIWPCLGLMGLGFLLIIIGLNFFGRVFIWVPLCAVALAEIFGFGGGHSFRIVLLMDTGIKIALIELYLSDQKHNFDQRLVMSNRIQRVSEMIRYRIHAAPKK